MPVEVCRYWTGQEFFFLLLMKAQNSIVLGIERFDVVGPFIFVLGANSN